MIKHSKTSALADGADSSLVRPSDWNADHVITGDVALPGALSVTGIITSGGEAIPTKTADYLAADTDEGVVMNGSNLWYGLPLNPPANRPIIVRNLHGSATLLIGRTGSRTINGSLQAHTLPAGGKVCLQATTSGWLTLWGDTLTALTVTIDGPSNVYVPQSSADLTALGLTGDFMWLVQEASGNLAATIGGVTLVANGSPLYRQTVTGWTRYFVGTADGSGDGQRFSTGSTAMNIASGESYARLLYVAATSVNTSPVPRISLIQGDKNYLSVAVTNGRWKTNHNPGSGSSVAEIPGIGILDIDVVHPAIWYRNAAISESGAKTDLGEVTVTHDESEVTSSGSETAASVRSLGAASGSYGHAATRVGLVIDFKGTNAERDWKMTLRRLAWPLSY